jgi:hypothetical protein
MVLADTNSWDRYECDVWLNGFRWLEANPTDPDVAEFRDWLEGRQQSYVEIVRDYVGWGVFILRPTVTLRRGSGCE